MSVSSLSFILVFVFQKCEGPSILPDVPRSMPNGQKSEPNGQMSVAKGPMSALLGFISETKCRVIGVPKWYPMFQEVYPGP